MKKLLTVIVPLVMLVAVASIGMASDQAAEQSEQDLNQELNRELSGDVSRDTTSDGDEELSLENDGTFGDTELNNTNSRETRSLAEKRGRQPRRGPTSSTLSDAQKYWGDHSEGDEDDEDDDEGNGETPVDPWGDDN